MKSSLVNNLIFLENKAQVLWVKQSLTLDTGTKLIAITAEALQMLKECKLPYEAIAAYDDPPQLRYVEEQINLDTFALASEIETFIGQRDSQFHFEGPGFLSGQGWYLQFSVAMIATRAFLMCQAIRACSPKIVTVFEGNVDLWFSGYGYSRDPWLELIAGLSAEYGFQYQPISDPTITATPHFEQSLKTRLHFLAVRAPGALWRRATLFFKKNLLTELAGLRLLIVDDDGYDWRPIIDILRNIAGVDLASLRGSPYNGNTANYSFHAYIPRLLQFNRVGLRLLAEFEVNSPAPTASEAQRLAELFEVWQTKRSTKPDLCVLGMDLFPAIKPYLQATIQAGPALVRHSDAIATHILENAQPHAVCFFAMPYLSAKRLAYQCQQRNIPVVCYQHGAQYNWRDSAKDEQIETMHADYFLTYGEKIQPRDKPAFPIRARYVPVGSARIEAMIAKSTKVVSTLKKNQTITVLWIADFPTCNTFGVITGDSEDTARYLLQKRCLQILSQIDNLQVTYRPYRTRAHFDGTTRWLKGINPCSIQIDSARRLDELICAADLVISDNFAGTIWAEVIGLKKPFILYCDPNIAHLSSRFIPDLERACYWCKSQEALVAAVRRLAVDRETFIAELQQIDATAFVHNHILHHNDGQCVQRVISFLNEVCRHGQSVDDWENREQ